MSTNEYVLACPKCARVWVYTGSADRATCPDCKGKVPVEKFSVEEIAELIQPVRSRQQKIESHIEDMKRRIEELEADTDDNSGFDFDQ